MPIKTALSVARCLVNFMGRYERIEKLPSDLVREFKAHVMEHLFNVWGMKKNYSALAEGVL